MNNIKKIIGLLVMLPLFTISLTVAGQIQTADAANISTIGGDDPSTISALVVDWQYHN